MNTEAKRFYKANRHAIGPAVMDDQKPAKKKRNVVLTPELSETKRLAAVARWGKTDRTPYKTIRLAERAVKLIREDAARRGISASQAVTDALETGDATLTKIK